MPTTAPATQSLLPADATWAGVMLLIITGLFLAAIVIGMVARVLDPDREESNDLPAKSQ